MDSNNFLDHVGVGEREGRVVSNLVHRRHYGFAHGIGRSGDVAAEQPKAAGSSLLAAVTSFLVGDALKLAGLEGASSPIILPLATGMAITMSLLALRHVCPSTAKYILWPRIDQKTCFKSMYTAGFEAVVIPMKVQGDQLVTDLEYLKSKIIELGTAQIAGVITTTSCFAPRAFDNVVGVAAVCAEHNIHHVINNAYGVQSKTLCREITLAWRKGRVDIVIQSTDKNFMVPVGGAILVAPRHEDALLRGIQRLYPGRASASTMIDVVITLLHLGHSGWVRILQQREDVYAYAKSRLENFAQEVGERVLETPDNPISLALTLSKINPAVSGKPTTYLGSMLFSRCISGSRVIAKDATETIHGRPFAGYGSHCDGYPTDYLTIAAALGTEQCEIDVFIKKLRECYKELLL